MFAFHNDKAANREEGHVVGSWQKTTLQVCYFVEATDIYSAQKTSSIRRGVSDLGQPLRMFKSF